MPDLEIVSTAAGPMTKPRSRDTGRISSYGFPLIGIAYLSLALSLTALVGLAIVVNRMDHILTPGHTDISMTSSPVIKGEVLMITGDACVVRDIAGTGILLEISKATKVAGTVRVGDMVEAHLSAEGKTISIRKTPL